MRVLMTVDAVGGVWRYAMDLGRALGPLGIKVVFAGSGPRPTHEQESEARRIGQLAWMSHPLDWMVDEESELEAVAKSILTHARDFDADLLHLNLPSQAAGLPSGLPVLSVSHSCVATWWSTMRGGQLPRQWTWQVERNRQGFRRSSAIVAPSQSHAHALRRCYGSFHIEVVENAVALADRTMAAEPYVFAAGRWWDEGKNAAVLDAAAVDLPWPILAAGSLNGPNGQRVQFANVHPIGEVPHAQVTDLASRAGIFVSPSRYEPFGLSALEAARLGRPLVLADIATYRELWENAAVFFEADSPAALSGALLELIADPARRAELGAAAQERSRSYMPDRQARRMAELYTSIIGTHGRAAQEQVA